MNSDPLVTVGMVIWNSASDLQDCLPALAQQSYRNLELIVVDNASADESLELVATAFPDARVIRNAVNEGFCRAHNQAIRYSRGEYYLALNPDVTMQPGYVSALVGALEARPCCGMAGGKLLLRAKDGQPKSIDSTGLYIDRRRRQYLRGHREADCGQYDHDGEVFGLDGAAPIYRKAMLDDIEVGGQPFDESFFAHKEDVDLAWRARLLGWRAWYVHEAQAFHRRSFRPGHRKPVASAIRVHAVKNRYLLLLKNESSCGWRRDWSRILWYDLKILVFLCLFERRSLTAIGMLRREWASAMKWRRQIQQRSRVDPQQMLGWFR